METQLTSPLFRLPPELRNMIYAFTFENNTISINKASWSFTHPRSQLLRTCKQIRSEALGIYYHSTTFVSGIFDNTCDWMEDQLFATHAAMVKKVKIAIAPGRENMDDEDLRNDYAQSFHQVAKVRGARLEMVKVTFEYLDRAGFLVEHSEKTYWGDGKREAVWQER